MQEDNSELKEKLKMVTPNVDKLSEELKSLQTILIMEKEKTNKICNNCDVINCENINNMKKHDKNHKSTNI